MTKKVMPEGCCACHNISIYSCSTVMAQPFSHCRFFLDNSSDLVEDTKPLHQNKIRKGENEIDCDRMNPCSEYKGVSPIFQIHRSSIHISNTTQLRIHMVGPREVEITCLECGALLHVYASKKGAFCQLSESKPVLMCGSYPSETLLGCLCFSSLPKSMRALFQKEEVNFFYNFENYNSEDLYDHSNSLPCEIDIESSKTLCNHETKLDFFNFSEGDENEDYDLMFSSQIEPVVGSYAELGIFLTNPNHLVM